MKEVEALLFQADDELNSDSENPSCGKERREPRRNNRMDLFKNVTRE